MRKGEEGGRGEEDGGSKEVKGTGQGLGLVDRRKEKGEEERKRGRKKDNWKGIFLNSKRAMATNQYVSKVVNQSPFAIHQSPFAMSDLPPRFLFANQIRGAVSP